MATRFTMLMQVTTAPANRGDASPHTGGWSESFWAVNAIVASDPSLLRLMRKRALLLPEQGSVVGYRLSNYNIVGNRLVPTGSSTGKVQLPGTTRITDVPQMALEMTGTSSNSANFSRFSVRCIPDGQVEFGEYQPQSGFKSNVTAYCTEIVAANWKFLGRDLSIPSYGVLSIANNVVTLTGNPGAVAGTSWLRFRRVRDNDGDPVTGSYLISAVAGNTVTLAGFPTRTLTVQSGTARLDAIALSAFATVEPSRIVVRKVGRPFESYRGRQSKR